MERGRHIGQEQIGGFAGEMVDLHRAITPDEALEEAPSSMLESMKRARKHAQCGDTVDTAMELVIARPAEQIAGRLMRKTLRREAETKRAEAQVLIEEGEYERAGWLFNPSKSYMQEAEELHRQYGKPGASERFQRRHKQSPFDNR